MKLFYLSLFLVFSTLSIALAQNETQPFGKVDQTDLELKECSFEKDANAMVLFDKIDVYFDNKFDIIMERHKRIKILNDKAKDEADIKLEYYAGNQLEYLTNLQAQTINLNNGKQTITKVEKKSIYTQTIDKSRSAVVFTFPDVQAGSVLEYKYVQRTVAVWKFPNWIIQDRLPVRYSEMKTAIPEYFYYKTQIRTRQPWLKNTTTTQSKTFGTGQETLTYNLEATTRALANIPSFRDEPFMTSKTDNQQCVLYQLAKIIPTYGFTQSTADTWPKVGKLLIEDEDFGKQFRKKIAGEEAIITKAKGLQDNAARIEYIFNEVKNTMKWNEIDRWYTNDGTSKAWEKKTGNSTEINLILYHLLKQAGIDAYPLMVSTRENGKVQVAYPSLSNFNKTVAYIPIDSTKNYILDATDKFNAYNVIPSDLLNSFGLLIDKDKNTYDLIPLNLNEPARQIILLNAKISPKGELEGEARISSTQYHKLNYQQRYKKEGEEKYKDFLRDNSNTLKIESIKVENLEVDTLPLRQSIAFKSEPLNADDDYIYLNTNQFLPLKSNPFLNEIRTYDIDFSFKNLYLLTGTYTVPQAFKIDALPKNISLGMPDQSIVFKRTVGEQEGTIVVRYNIEYKKSLYFKEDYHILREFHQKMFDMLNEAIVLKKI